MAGIRKENMADLFDNSGFISGGVFNVTPREAYELCGKGAVFVDVREEYLNNFKNPEVPETIFIPLSELNAKYSGLPADRYLIIADSVGLRSKEAFIFLKEKGFSRIANMAGGIVEWEQDGLPIRTNIEERLSGSCMCQLKPRERKKI